MVSMSPRPLSSRMRFILGNLSANPLSCLSLLWMLSKATSMTSCGPHRPEVAVVLDGERLYLHHHLLDLLVREPRVCLADDLEDSPVPDREGVVRDLTGPLAVPELGPHYHDVERVQFLLELDPELAPPPGRVGALRVLEHEPLVARTTSRRRNRPPTSSPVETSFISASAKALAIDPPQGLPPLLQRPLVDVLPVRAGECRSRSRRPGASFIAASKFSILLSLRWRSWKESGCAVPERDDLPVKDEIVADGRARPSTTSGKLAVISSSLLENILTFSPFLWTCALTPSYLYSP